MVSIQSIWLYRAAFLLFTQLPVALSVPQTYDALVVNTTSGLVRGKHISSNVKAFRGIPYAQPPLGELRFEPPRAIERPSNRVLDATKYGYVCLQHRYNFVATIPRNEDQENEDCLTLNVFVPQQRGQGKKTEEGLLPVLIWIYGGGFGEGYAAAYDPTFLVQNNPDVIVATFNYRLNLFGFPNTPARGNDRSNPGVRDQRAAITWIHDNIRFFGGDPSRLVIAGESAGGTSVALYLTAYPDDPLVAGAIQMSGPTTGSPPADSSEYDRVARTVGCTDPNDREAELECMKTIDPRRLKGAISNTTLNEPGTPTTGGSPRYDEVTVFSPEVRQQRLAAGRIAKVPVLMGTTEHEGDYIAPWTSRGVNRTLSDIITLDLYHCTVAGEANTTSLIGIPTYRYRYRGIFPLLQPYRWLRSYHGSEVLILFGHTFTLSNRYSNGEYSFTPFPANSLEHQAMLYLQRAFIAFIKDPLRGVQDELHWPLYNANSNTNTLIEIFKDNKIGAELSNPSDYDKPCANPPPFNPADLLIRPPPCDPCFD
ncbi:MAG: hypothetical protein M1816_004616 [Peltula sp. TS41687]|nr:MAG: hypothetical protein M1816_004616 [Peltula sp. TS41687]